MTEPELSDLELDEAWENRQERYWDRYERERGTEQ